jgi:hypothetical protein
MKNEPTSHSILVSPLWAIKRAMNLCRCTHLWQRRIAGRAFFTEFQERAIPRDGFAFSVNLASIWLSALGRRHAEIAVFTRGHYSIR